jgi:FixJ family two-component response regulator
MIAIVEDDASVRKATQSLVQSVGFSACTFASAEEFMRSPDTNGVSCLISDVQLPGMSGVELQRVLIAQGRNMPVIFMSAFEDAAVRARALKAGAVCFLNKPVGGQTFIECLEKALKKGN